MLNFFEQRRLQLTNAEGKPATQRFIADQLGMTSAAVGAWERGTAVPRPHLIPRLAKIYGVSERRLRDEIYKLSVEPAAALA